MVVESDCNSVILFVLMQKDELEQRQEACSRGKGEKKQFIFMFTHAYTEDTDASSHHLRSSQHIRSLFAVALRF
jgi:hypothetical protein